jgi:hypothetical protein
MLAGRADVFATLRPLQEHVWMHARSIKFQPRAGAADGTPTHLAFAALCAAFEPYGGLARGDDVAQRLSRLRGTGLGDLARRIIRGELICFEFEREFWLPLLQFDPADMSVRPALARVAAELRGIFDDWNLCRWLAAPNFSLNECAPLDVLERHPEAVLQAARVAAVARAAAAATRS